MPLQDLTPELRTRLSRVERAVGWFVILAVVLLLAGFAFYIRATAKSRGWFLTKINYATALNDFSGFKIGDPVKIMGFPAGEITDFSLNAPEKPHGIKIYFTIRQPFYNYIWYDSVVSIKSDILGNRYLEISKGQYGVPTVSSNLVKGKLLVLNRYKAFQKFKSMTNGLNTNVMADPLTREAALIDMTNQLMKMLTNEVSEYYTNASSGNYTKPADLNPNLPPEKWNYCWIPAFDTPSIEDRLGGVAAQIEIALPNFLRLTNQIQEILSNTSLATGHLNDALVKVDPVLTNVAVITGNLRDPNGSLGNWIVPTNLSAQLHQTLNSARETLDSAHKMLDDSDTNVTMLALDLDKTLEHLADLTSNLDHQVQVNTNLITDISTTIEHTDSFIQGLKHHWLLRSAFKTKKPPKTKKPDEPALTSPRQKSNE